MLTYITRRTIYSIPVILIASFLLFWMVRVTFDSCAKQTASKDPTAVARCRDNLRLDDPITTQFGRWVSNASHGDFGQSERITASKQADQIMAQDQVSLPLDPLPNIVLWSNKITGPVGDNPLLSMFWNMYLWRVQG